MSRMLLPVYHGADVLQVARENLPARRLYDQCGFKPIFLQTLPADWRNRQRSNIFLVKELDAMACDRSQ